MNSHKITDSFLRHEMWLLYWHEKHVQSIPVLWRKDSSFWPKTQAMRKLPKNLENPNQKARSASGQNTSCFVGTNLSATANTPQSEPTALSQFSGFELPVSKSSAKIRSAEIYSKMPQRPIDSLARWGMVRFQEATMDSPSGCSQTGHRSSRFLLGSPPSGRYRKLERMAAVHRNAPSQCQKTHLCRRVRQFSRCEETCLSESLDSAIVSFSHNQSIPIQKRTSQTSYWAFKNPRITLSTDPSSPGTSRWRTSPCHLESLAHVST